MSSKVPALSEAGRNLGRVLCFGGSFNPPHHGHLIVAQAVAEQAGFGRVRLIVSGSPPHKPDDPAVIPAEHRVAMCRLAVAGDDRFEVDDREARRPGPSYTIDTAFELIATDSAFAGGPVYWLIGADLLPGLSRWHRPEALFDGRTVQFLVMRRPGYAIDWHAFPPAVRALRDAVVDAPELDISATDIRRRVREQRDVRYLVPETVCRYIAEHGLYT